MPEDTPAENEESVDDLRSKAAAGAAALAEAAELRKELAFRRAVGDVVDTNVGQLVMKSYEGDDLSPDAIREYANQYALPADPAPAAAPAEALSPEEIQQRSAAEQAAAGGRSDVPPGGSEDKPTFDKVATREKWVAEAKVRGHQPAMAGFIRDMMTNADHYQPSGGNPDYGEIAKEYGIYDGVAVAPVAPNIRVRD